MKNSISALFLVLLSSSCEKVVNLKYKNNQPRIVIAGNITDQPGPYFVRVTQSVNLTATNADPTIDNAEVSISDDAGNSETLSPQGNGIYSTALLKGVPGRIYTLSVQTAGGSYLAQSTMPQPVLFDSVKTEEIVSAGEKQYNLIPVYRDPLEKGNNYRFELRVNSKLINQHFVYNDDVHNGLLNHLRLETNDNDLTLKPGDSISIAMHCIDRQVYLFYKTLALTGDSGPGGGTTPNNPPNNISNGALGLFSAHTVATQYVILP